MKDKIEKAFFYMVEQKDKGRKFISPTEIGQIFGGRHSSFGSPICKRMVELGLAQKKLKSTIQNTLAKVASIMSDEPKPFSLDSVYLCLKKGCQYLDKDWCNREGHPCTLKDCQLLAEIYLYSLKVARRKGIKHP